MSVSAIQPLNIAENIPSSVSERDLAASLYELGLNYATGHGVERNLVEAHKWLNLASVHGNRAAEVDREEVAKELSRREIAKALRLAREWNATH